MTRRSGEVLSEAGPSRAAARRAFARKLLIFSLVAAAAITALGWFHFSRRHDAVRAEVFTQLHGVAAAKVEQIVRWREERAGDARVVREASVFARAVSAFLARPDDAEARQVVLEWFRAIRRNYEYSAVLLHDAAGRYVAGAGAPASAETSLPDAARLRDARDVVFEEMRRGDDGDLRLDVLVPLRQPDAPGELLAVVVLRVDPRRDFFGWLQSWPTPSPTAETTLFYREGDEVVCLNELRHQRETALTLRLPVSLPDLPAARGARGEFGVFEGRDYRGVPVLAAVAAIPGSPWHIVAKVDQAEVYAPVQAEARQVAVVVGTLLVALAATVGSLWWRNSSRLLEATLAAERGRAELAERFSTLAQYANDIIVVADADFRILEANERAQAAYGYSLAELRGLTVADLRAAEARVDFAQDRERLERAGGLRFETVHRRKDGGTFPVEVSSRFVGAGAQRRVLSIVRDISERRQAEQALRASEARFRSTLETMLEGCQIVGFDWRFLYVNAAAARHGRKAVGDLTGRRMMEVYPGIEGTPLFAVLRRCLEERVAQHCENEFVYADGSSAWFQLSLQPVPEGCFILSIDVTALRETELALRTSEARFRAYVEQAADAIFVHDREGRFTDANPSACLSLGYSREELLRMTVCEVETGFDLPRAQALWDATEPGAATTVQGRHRRKDGTVFPVEVRFGCFDLPEGRRFIGLVRDVSERERADAELRDSEERQRLFIEHAPVSLAMFDREMRYLHASRRWLDSYGLGARNLRGVSHYDVFPEIGENWKQVHRRALAGEVVRSDEDRFDRADGSVQWLRWEVRPWRDGLGRIGGIVIFAEDITERKSLEGAMRQWADAFTHCAHGIAMGVPSTNRLLACNPAFARMVGRALEEIPGLAIADFYAPDARPQLRAWIAEADRTGQVRYETEMIRPDGTTVPVQMDLVSVRDAAGRPLYRVATAQDITERKRVTAALHESEARRALALDAARAGTWEWNLATGRNTWSEELWALYGLAPHSCEPSYEAWAATVHPDDLAGAERRLGELVRQEAELHLEWRVKGPGESPRWLLSRGRPERDGAGRVVRYLGVVMDITERKRAEEAARQNEQRLNFALQASRTGAWSLNLQDRTATRTPIHARIFGYEDTDGDWSVAQFIGHIVPDEREQVRQRIQEGIAAKTGWSFECRIRRTDGEIRWVFVAGGLEGTGGAAQVYGIIQDITERKLAETALRESEERHRLAVDAAHLGTFEWDLATNQIVWSTRHEQLWAFAPGEFDGTFDAFSSRVHPDDLPGVNEEVRRSMAEHRTYEREFRVVWPDGSVHWIAGRGRFEYDADGRAVRMRGVTFEITRLKEGEESLRQRLALQDQLTKTAATVPGMLFTFRLHPDGRMTLPFCTPIFEDLWGMPPAPLREDFAPAFALVHPDDRAAGAEKIEESARTLQAWRDTFRVRHPAKGERWLEGHSLPLRAPDGGVLWHGFLQDVTERKRLEAERLAMEAQMRQQQKLESIGTLAGGVAHEINNPINGIMNYAQLIQDGLPAGSPLGEYTSEILHETQRVAGIVRNLLTFARNERQSHSPARMSDIVDAVLSLVRTIIRRDQITLTVDVPDDLPKLKCRSQQIQQVLMNLLTNARDALNTRYPEHDADKVLNVSARLFEKEGRRWIRLTVEDHGTGIPPEVRERMFDPFFTTKPRDRGTGLGLAISHGIVREHHGEWSVETEVGRFTRMHVDLPVDNGWEV